MTSGKSINILLFLLERNDIPQEGEWYKCVVAAPSEQEARELANQDSLAEGYVWSDGSLVSCVEIGVAKDGIHGIQLFSKERID